MLRFLAMPKKTKNLFNNFDVYFISFWSFEEKILMNWLRILKTKLETLLKKISWIFEGLAWKKSDELDKDFLRYSGQIRKLVKGGFAGYYQLASALLAVNSIMSMKMRSASLSNFPLLQCPAHKGLSHTTLGSIFQRFSRQK